MRIKKNGVPISYHRPDTVPHKENGCMGCEYRDNEDCGTVGINRINTGAFYKKMPDRRCKHESQEAE